MRGADRRLASGAELALNKMGSTRTKIDNRTARAQRHRKVLAGLQAELGGELSETQQVLASRIASLTVWCEHVEAEMLRGSDLDASGFVSSINTLRRLLADLGLTHDSEPPELARAKRVRHAVSKEISRRATT